MENKNNSFVVTVTPITDDLNSDTDNKLQIPRKKNFKKCEQSLQNL